VSTYIRCTYAVAADWNDCLRRSVTDARVYFTMIYSPSEAHRCRRRRQHLAQRYLLIFNSTAIIIYLFFLTRSAVDVFLSRSCTMPMIYDECNVCARVFVSVLSTRDDRVEVHLVGPPYGTPGIIQHAVSYCCRRLQQPLTWIITWYAQPVTDFGIRAILLSYSDARPYWIVCISIGDVEARFTLSTDL